MSLNKIKKLPQELINQIAAGEMIAGPASVLKELIENSIDAKATHIQIFLKSTGVESIKVIDNGLGMSKEDILLAFCFHATSKISNMNDFMHAQTLGYRGEALASMATVSEMSIASCLQGSETAWKISTFGSTQHSKCEMFSMPAGTMVEVLDLFFNIPARRSFLTAAKTGLRHLETVFFNYVMSMFNVHFELIHEGNKIYNYPACQTKEDIEARLEKVLQVSSEHLLEVNQGHPKMNLVGWFGNAMATKKRANKQYFFVNGRPVQDRMIAQLIRIALSDVLHHGSHSVFNLSLTLPFDWVDCNVHPQKTCVMFRSSQEVRQFLLKSFRAIAAQCKPIVTEHQAKLHVLNKSLGGVAALVNQSFESTQTSQQISLDSMMSNHQDFKHPYITQNKRQENLETPALGSFESLNQGFARQQEEDVFKEKRESKYYANYPLGYALGCIGKTYAIARHQDGLILVDVHAAHERIIYESLKRAFENNIQLAQSLLVPIGIDLTYFEARQIELARPMLEKIGFDIEAVSSSSFMISSTPQYIDQQEAIVFLKDLLESEIIADTDLFLSSVDIKFQEHVYEKLANLACKHAWRMGDVIHIDEVNALLRQLETVESGNQCNHGRPTWTRISMSELDKYFKRGQ